MGYGGAQHEKLKRELQAAKAKFEALMAEKNIDRMAKSLRRSVESQDTTHSRIEKFGE